MNLRVSVSRSLQPLQLPPARARCICPGQNGMFLPPVTHSGQVPSITRLLVAGCHVRRGWEYFLRATYLFSKKWLQIQVNAFFVILSDPIPPCKTEKKPYHYFFDSASDLRLDYCSSCTPREGEISWQVLRGLMSNDSEDFDWAGGRARKPEKETSNEGAGPQPRVRGGGGDASA